MTELIKTLFDTDSQYCAANACKSNQAHFHLGQWTTHEKELQFRELFDVAFINGATLHILLSKRNLVHNLICHFVGQTICYRRSPDGNPVPQCVLDRDWLLARISEVEKAFRSDEERFVASLSVEMNNPKRVGLKSITNMTAEGGGIGAIDLQELFFSGDSISLVKEGPSFRLRVINQNVEVSDRIDKLIGAHGWRTLVDYPAQTSVTCLTLCDQFMKSCNDDVGLAFAPQLCKRFITALSAKPFVVLTGLSGSGKTKIAQSFVKWIGTGSMSLDGCFYEGLEIQRSQTNLKILKSDSMGVVVAQGNGSRTVLSRELIDQYAYSLMQHGPNVTKNDVMADHPNIKYSPTMHMFDSTLIPLAAYKLENKVPKVRSWLLVPVGADWTNSEKLLGYPNALDKTEYVMPDTGVLKLMMEAEKNPKLPFFLILDEMNLSHVERYFADFLSAMESGDEIKLYDGDQRYGDKEKTIAIPRRIRVPKNLFVIGTMNVDETTYMFSPKVLDRAQVIEFRVKDKEMADFVGHFDANNQWVDGKATQIDLSKLADANGVGKGAKYAESFLELALKRGEKKPSDQAISDANNPDNGKVPLQEIAKALNAFFKPLAELGAEFGYRSAVEILAFCGYYLDTGATIDQSIDAAVIQKLLPKLHGSRRKLEQVLPKIWEKCRVANNNDVLVDVAKITTNYDFGVKTIYPMSAEKVLRMFRAAVANGFASFAEA